MKERLKILINIPYFSVYLLVIFYIITSLNDALWITDWKDLIWVFIFFALILFLIITISSKIRKNIDGKEVLIFISLFTILLLPKLQSNLISFTDLKIKLSYLLITFGIIIIFFLYQIFLNQTKKFRILKQYFTLLICSFILIEISIVPGILDDKKMLKNSIFSYTNSIQKKPIALKIKPNVYHIVFDAYTGFEALKKYWSFEDTVFMNKLHQKNANLAINSKTCKDNTLESINSTFNMKIYQNSLRFRSLATKSDVFRKLIKKASTINQLEFNDYEINNLSIFDLGNKKRNWDFPWLEPNINFYQYCFYQSLLGNFYKNYLNRSIATSNINIISELKNIIKKSTNKPKFTYAHLIMPHTPNNFDKNGNIIGSITYNKDAYLDELQYCNKVMIEMINLINKYDPNAVLILQSDHGSGMLPEVYEEEVANTLSILVAPKIYKIEWPQNMLNHNTYKYIFNALGNYSIPISPCDD